MLMLYKLRGQTLRVEYEFYDQDEGQPVQYVDFESITDNLGRPVNLSESDSTTLAHAAIRHQTEANRASWKEFHLQARLRQERAAGSPCGRKLVTLHRA